MRRMMLGMSQTSLGEGLGLTFQQIQKYEKGANRIGASRLLQIAEILQVPVAFFFEGIDDAVPPDAGRGNVIVELASTADGVALARAFVKISDPKLRKAIVALVERLVNFEDSSSK